ncbi:MAG: hypothetical protein AABZ61_09170, partial [Bacteroidota bacterium]
MRNLALSALLPFFILTVSAIQQSPHDPFAIIAEFDRIASDSLWPSFDPRSIPVAIYDGEKTYLFRHPSPPKEFSKIEDHKDAWVFKGQHPTLRANTDIDLNGTRTATIILDQSTRRSVRELAAIVIHETFHVFQRQRHPTWVGNEAELFVYPVADASLLQLQRLETEALRRALAATESSEMKCWAKSALEIRHARFARLPEGSVAYERGTELNEGLAQYVEFRAARTLKAPSLPKDEFAPDDIRRRCYAVGQSLAVLLDRLDPAWPRRLGGGQALSLDELLGATLSNFPTQSCGFSEAEREMVLTKAEIDIEEVRAKKIALRNDFLSQLGWKIIVIADEKELLWPQGFDPLNVHRVGDGEVLHMRWLKLGNAAGM